MGCQFALDDFGVGFSSFGYIRELPVDIIKIDGIFIKDLDKNTDDQLFVKALIDVAKGMGKKTTAEYVENAEILALLKEFGVDHAQGYHIGRPKPEADYADEWGFNITQSERSTSPIN
ncbi:MAG: EAL domain-containing protein (putative c-di-GMP-specific phosphodiesterase class I) [Methylophagaceae bacterium]